jgi:hypothetical protein
MSMNRDAVFWTGTKRKTAWLLLGAALLSIATPIVVGLTQPGARFYVFQPMIFAGQVIPNLVAAGLWLPWRSARASKVGLWLAVLLFVAFTLLYLPAMTGIVPTTGDMIGLGYILVALVTTVSIVVATIVAYGLSWVLRRGAVSNGRE